VWKCGTFRQAIGDNIIWRMWIAYWIFKATNTHSEYVILITFPLKNSYAKAPQSYVTVHYLSYNYIYIYIYIYIYTHNIEVLLLEEKSFDSLIMDWTLSYIYRVSQQECARLREGVPYVKVYPYNPKHLCPKLNGYGDNGHWSLKLWQMLHTYWLPNTY